MKILRCIIEAIKNCKNKEITDIDKINYVISKNINLYTKPYKTIEIVTMCDIAEYNRLLEEILAYDFIALSYSKKTTIGNNYNITPLNMFMVNNGVMIGDPVAMLNKFLENMKSVIMLYNAGITRSNLVVYNNNSILIKEYIINMQGIINILYSLATL